MTLATAPLLASAALGALAAQDTLGEGVGLLALAGARLTPLAGEATGLLGGGLLLRLGPRIAVGGGGWASPSLVELDAPGTAMSFGYGGLLADVTAVRRPRLHAGGRILLGAGNVSVHNTVVGVEVAADNTLVGEPEVTAGLRLFDRVRVTASGGWRFVLGLDRSTGVASSDLEGWTFSLALAIGPF